MRHNQGIPEREVHRDTGLPKKDRNISKKQPTYKNSSNKNKDSPEQVEGRK